MIGFIRSLFARPHRFICLECGATWDRWSSLNNPGHSPRWPPPPGGDKRPLHYVAVSRIASDGVRLVAKECGPVVYEGRRR